MESDLGPDKAKSVTGMIISYVDSGGTEDDTQKINKLRYLIMQETRIRVDAEYIRKKVSFLRKEWENKEKLEKTIGDVFGRDLPDPRYRMGSGFCPKCKRFKNFEKECPFCSNLEMSL